jgi:acetyl esterase/lipase
MRHLPPAAFAFACLLAACATDSLDTAPPSQVPPAIARELKAIGPVVDPFETPTLYRPLAQVEPYDGVRVTRDARYGPAPRNRLDVFAAAPLGPRAKPVLLFVHGGGYITGDKHAPGSPYFDNVMLWAARHGFVGIDMTYRLAPGAPWPAVQEDIAAALAWIRANIAVHGGDPDRVVLMGHSSGATHIAQYLAHAEFQPPSGPGVAAAVLMSGLFDPTKVDPNPGVVAYFGANRSRYIERSALPGLAHARVPLLLVVAELDPPGVHAQTELARKVLCRAGACPQMLYLRGHSHVSEVLAINTADTVLTDAVLAFAAMPRPR